MPRRFVQALLTASLLAAGLSVTAVAAVIVDALVFPSRSVRAPSELHRVSLTIKAHRASGVDGLVPASIVSAWRDAADDVLLTAISPPRAISRMRTSSSEYVYASHVAADFFSVLAIPLAGGGISPSEFRSLDETQAVVSYEFWRRHLKDRIAIGQPFEVFEPGRTLILTGVMPEGFRFPAFPTPIDLFLAGESRWDVDDQSTAPALLAIVRVPGLSRARAVTVLAAIAMGATAATAADVQLSPVFAEDHTPLARWAKGAGAAIGIVLTLTSIGLLTLAASYLYQKESRCRMALILGARWYHLLVPLLGRQVPIFASGSLVAAALAVAAQRWSVDLSDPAIVPIVAGMDALRLAALVTLAAGLLFVATQVVPIALRLVAIERTLVGVRSLARRGGSSLGAAFQLAVGVAVLSVGWAIVLELAKQWNEVGYDDRDLIVVELRGPVAGSQERVQNITEELRRQPSVVAVAAVSDSLYQGTYRADENWRIPVGARRTCLGGPKYSVTPGFFEMVGVTPLRGHLPSAEAAGAGTPQVAMNTAMAEACFPRSDAVGQRVLLGATWYSVVGIVRNASFLSLGRADGDQELYRIDQSLPPSTITSILIKAAPRTRAGTAVAIQQNIVAKAPPDLGITLTPVSSALQRSAAGLNLALMIVGGLSLAAMVVVAISLFGFAHNESVARRGEIGLRLALGSPYTGIWLGLWRALQKPLIVGLSSGCLAAWLMLSAARPEIPGSQSLLPIVASVGAVLVIVAGGVRAGAGWIVEKPLLELLSDPDSKAMRH